MSGPFSPVIVAWHKTAARGVGVVWVGLEPAKNLTKKAIVWAYLLQCTVAGDFWRALGTGLAG